MALKCWRALALVLGRSSAPQLCNPRKVFLPHKVTPVRGSFLDHYIPPDQYTHYNTSPNPKFQFPGTMYKYYELIPLMVCNAIAVGGVVFNVIWALSNKVELVLTTHSRKNISRTMNLLAPTCHKMITINQEYRPWPEMACVLRKMKEAQCARKNKRTCKN